MFKGTLVLDTLVIRYILIDYMFFHVFPRSCKNSFQKVLPIDGQNLTEKQVAAEVTSLEVQIRECEIR